MNHTSEFGQLSEHYASQYLKNKGYEILDSNFRKPWGELDVIAKKEGILIFVEVKANNIMRHGFEPELRADPKKIKKIIRTARTYLLQKKYPEDQIWQVDVLSLTFIKERGIIKIKHYKNIDV